MSIVGAFMVPHPPIIVPEIGRGEEQKIEKTIAAYHEVGREIAALRPETIVVSSPHNVMYYDYFNISSGKTAKGDFSQFRAPQVRMKYAYDTELVKTICGLAKESKLAAGTLGTRDPSLDHGTMVPLYFIRKYYNDFRLVRIGLSGQSLSEHYRFGQLIQKAVEETGRRVVYVASGDLSHKYSEESSYGFSPAGPEYDKRIMDVMGRGDFGELFTFEESFLQKAAECGHRSFVIMAGALDRTAVEAKTLSHEGPWGIGYGVCTYHVTRHDPTRNFLEQWDEQEQKRLAAGKAKEDPYVKLARMTVESYVRNKIIPSIPKDLPEEMVSTRAGAFVSLHEEGQLRGCIGTTGPAENCIASEIIQNAVSAATRDPRFSPVRVQELPKLEYSVDILGEPELIDSPEQLDVKKYGVIVSNGQRRGLLLPDLGGVDTVEQQIAIARKKADIGPYEDVRLQRFTVERHT